MSITGNAPQVYGNYSDPAKSREFMLLSLALPTTPIETHFYANSLSADYLATYWGKFIPCDKGAASNSSAQVRDAVGFASNELMENAMKFSTGNINGAIKVSLYLYDSELWIYVTNEMYSRNTAKFISFIQRIFTENTSDMYFEQLENNSRNETSGESGLGILTLINDYGVDLSWKFEACGDTADVTAITTLARLPILRKIEE